MKVASIIESIIVIFDTINTYLNGEKSSRDEMTDETFLSLARTFF